MLYQSMMTDIKRPKIKDSAMNFRGLNVPKDDIVCKYFTVFSVDSLLVYDNQYYL